MTSHICQGLGHDRPRGLVELVDISNQDADALEFILREQLLRLDTVWTPLVENPIVENSKERAIWKQKSGKSSLFAVAFKRYPSPLIVSKPRFLSKQLQYSPALRINDNLKKNENQREKRKSWLPVLVHRYHDLKHELTDKLLWQTGKPTLCSAISFSMNALALPSLPSAGALMALYDDGFILFGGRLLCINCILCCCMYCP